LVVKSAGVDPEPEAGKKWSDRPRLHGKPVPPVRELRVPEEIGVLASMGYAMPYREFRFGSASGTESQ